MIFKLVTQKLLQNGRRKIAFRLLILHISVHSKKYGGIVRYVERTGELLLIVGLSEELVVPFVLERIDIIFLIRKTCSLKRLQVFFTQINCIQFSDKSKNDVMGDKKIFCSGCKTGKRRTCQCSCLSGSVKWSDPDDPAFS